MNQVAQDFINQYASTELTAWEYEKQMTNARNMDMLCHNSHYLDLSTIRYLSVKNLVLNEDGNYFVLIISDVSQFPKDSYDRQELYYRSFSYTLIQNIVQKAFSNHCMFYCAEIDGILAVLLCFLHDSIEEDNSGFLTSMENDCQNILTLCKEKFDIDVSIYISSFINGIRPIALEYEKLSNHKNYRHFSKLSHVSQVVAPQDNNNKSELTFFLLDYAKKLAIIILNFEDFNDYANAVLKKLTGNSIISTEELKTHFSNFLAFLFKELSNAGIPMDAKYLNQEIPLLFYTSVYWDEIVDWFFEFLKDTAARYNSKHQSISFQRLFNIKSHIDNNFHDVTLCVSQLADTFCMNQTFLSTIFKRQYKVSISSYIQTLRLRRAEELLKTTTLTINEIYQNTGFGSSETFYRSFRKEYGVSPNRIRHI